jgi:hypothetical protein
MGEIGIEWLRPETPVWRYMDYDRVVEMIEGEEIHFHRSDSFSDPLEGSVPRAVRDMSDKTYDEVAEDNDNAKETLRSAFERIRKVTFLNCWHLNTGESMAMWRLYGKSNKTVAIKSTVGRLSRAIEEPSGGVTVIAPVFYADYDSSYEDLDRASRKAVDIVFSADRAPTMHDLYQMKESSFRHESEVRIIYQGMEAITEPTDDEDDNAGWRGDLPFETKEETDEPVDEGFNQSVDADELIELIRMSPDSSSQAQRDLGRVLDDADSVSLSSDDVLPTTVPGDPIFEAGSYLFERLVNAAPEGEE